MGQEHLAFAKEVANDIHAVEQWAFDDLEGLVVGAEGFGEIFFEIIGDALEEGVSESFGEGGLSPSIVESAFFGVGLVFISVRDQAIGGVFAAVEEDVFDALKEGG